MKMRSRRLCAADMSPPPLSMFSKRSRCLPTRRCAKCRIWFSLRISAPPPRKRRKVSASRSRNRFAPRLLEGTIRNAVNMPNLDAKTLAIVGPHLLFGEKLGRFLSQIAPRRAENLNINYSGKVNEVDTTAITRSVLKGFLQTAGGNEVNEVNAPAFAESLGLKINETRLSAAGDYTDLLELSASGEGKDVSVAGAFFGATPRIVSINSRPVEARPHGVVLVLENTDRPGMVGRIGTLLGDHGVNIATMSLSRNQAGGTALTVLNLDTAPDAALLAEIRASEDIHSAQVIELALDALPYCSCHPEYERADSHERA